MSFISCLNLLTKNGDSQNITILETGTFPLEFKYKNCEFSKNWHADASFPQWVTKEIILIVRKPKKGTKLEMQIEYDFISLMYTMYVILAFGFQLHIQFSFLIQRPWN